MARHRSWGGITRGWRHISGSIAPSANSLLLLSPSVVLSLAVFLSLPLRLSVCLPLSLALSPFRLLQRSTRRTMFASPVVTTLLSLRELIIPFSRQQVNLICVYPWNFNHQDFASVASALLLRLLLGLVSKGFEEHWTNIMSDDQPILCLPFSCLVTPALWVSRPPLLWRRDAGTCCLSLLIWLLALRIARGQSISDCVSAKVTFVCAHLCSL